MNPRLKSVIKAVVPRPIIHAGMKILKANPGPNASRAGRRSRIDFALEKDAAFPPALVWDTDWLTTEWLVRRLRQDAPNDLRAWFYHNECGARLSICTINAQVRPLMTAIVRIASESGLGIKVLRKGNWITPTSFVDLFLHVANRRVVNIRFSTPERILNFRIEQWVQDEGVLSAPRVNAVTRRLDLREGANGQDFLNIPGQNLREVFDYPLEDDITFPIDAVFTWVNSEDPDWQALYNTYAKPLKGGDATAPVSGEGLSGDVASDNTFLGETGLPKEESAASQSLETSKLPEAKALPEGATLDRFKNRDELRYALRSLADFAPWIRKVYVLSNCAPPAWFNADSEVIEWVWHETVLDEGSLPTFSSHAIEARIHRIPGLGEHFLYLNDDVFFVQSAMPADFFLSNGLPKLNFENYGSIHGVNESDDADYMKAARNGQRLLERKFGLTATQVHKHTPFPMRRSVMYALEETFPDAFAHTASQRFRSDNDISPTSFLFPHYSYMSAQAVKSDYDYKLIKSARNYKKDFEDILLMMARNETASLPKIICINDGAGSAQNPDWNAAVNDFLQKAFPHTSKYELVFPN